MARSTRSTLFYITYLLIAIPLLVELTLRLFFAVQTGPRVLLYGTPWQRQAIVARPPEELEAEFQREWVSWNKAVDAMDFVSEKLDERGGYFKFFPNETKQYRDIDTGEFISVKINRHGFRGKDFSIEKPEGVTRVLTLGASSTFGYFNPDDATYPVFTQTALNARCAGATYEVINFGIPHLIADEIRTLFLFEGLALEPDVVTFYEGRNDSDQRHPLEFLEGVEPSNTTGRSAFRTAWQGLRNRLVTARFLDSLFEAHAVVPEAQSNVEHLRAIGDRTSQGFLSDLDAIRQACAERGILFIVVSQQANSKSWFGLPLEKRLALKGVSYDDEVAAIRTRLEQGRTISGYEFNFLIHDRLMQDLEAWAAREQIPFVDYINALGDERHHMISYAHVDTYANRLLGSVLADEILLHTCPETKR